MQVRWPTLAIQDFTVRMGGHGFSVSGTLMSHDPGYALEQLKQAHSLADETLREMAAELSRYFERTRPGIGLAN